MQAIVVHCVSRPNAQWFACFCSLGIHYLCYVASDACLAFEPVNSLKVNSLQTMLEMPDKVGQSILTAHFMSLWNVPLKRPSVSSSAQQKSILRVYFGPHFIKFGAITGVNSSFFYQHDKDRSVRHPVENSLSDGLISTLCLYSLGCQCESRRVTRREQQVDNLTHVTVKE